MGCKAGRGEALADKLAQNRSNPGDQTIVARQLGDTQRDRTKRKNRVPRASAHRGHKGGRAAEKRPAGPAGKAGRVGTEGCRPALFQLVFANCIF